ncbi:uncharacterized protein MELLADRAFT_61476 [Melampsora larici-populina 98AG31]|uniref:Uncharacterized protein n=1 Tax=Melampsora larici-populina (strain 98AG31 / pathotype 3-4-7) TaxID=747676 RepID=F4RF18_MELLP|nr:uncharacterized protein MELLADRAFT_61476 [Melampsora larici-populina 98AG31]EGG08740.1 hypothetical protein MELLADRAFT_61476 [Melampsora larici-populina 98AG31]
MEQQLLFNSLGGMLAGGMTASWIAGMAIVEGLRAAQELYLYPSIAFKTYIMSVMTLSFVTTGLFGATLYHHFIKSFGDYDSVDRIYPLLSASLVLFLSLLAQHENHRRHMVREVDNRNFFLVYDERSVWYLVISRMRGLYLPLILMMVMGFLVLGSGLASGIAAYNFFQQTSYSVMQTKLGIWQAMFFMELACDLGLTAIRAVYMYRANDIKAVITHAGHPYVDIVLSSLEHTTQGANLQFFTYQLAGTSIRYVADICLLVARTPIYNAIFALITFASASYTFSYLMDKPNHALGTSDGEHKGFPDELFAFNNRMHDSRLDAQRIVRPPWNNPKPIDDLFVDDEDEFASDGIKMEPEVTSPKGQPSGSRLNS